MIPKVIHCCWFGGAKKTLALKCRASWERLAPDFTVREWNEASAETLGDLPGYGFFKASLAAKKWAMASDWLRMAALYEEGGVYLDLDVELVREIDSLDGEWVASEWAVGGGTWLNPGSGIALKKGSAIAEYMLKAYESAGFDASREMMAWINRQLKAASCLASPVLRVLPPEVFSPIDVNGVCHQTAETRGIHHYAMSWAGPKRRFARWLAWHGGRRLVERLLRVRKRFSSLAVVCASLASFADVVVVNPDFERGNGTEIVGWQTSSTNFAIVGGAGLNGNRGLVWHRAEKGGPETITQDLTGWSVGERYTVTAKARTQDFTSDNWWGANAGLIVLDHNDKWLGEAFTHVHGANTPYTKKSATTKPIPENAARLVLTLMAGGRGHTRDSGTVAWDEISVTRVEVKPIGFMRTSAYRNEAMEGIVRFGVALEVPYAHKGKVAGAFAWRDAAGDVQRVPAEKLTDSEAIVHLDVGRFAFGTTKVGFRLFAADGTTLGQTSLDFVRPRVKPSHRVALDEHGRCLVDGQPFFPLGLYFRHATPQDELDLYRTGPFNCLMPYGRMQSNDLDRVHAAGLKTFIAFQGILKSSKNGIKYGYTTDEKVDAFYRNRVQAFKDHPAVLGWYLFDEPADAILPELSRLYGLVCRADPDHPVWGVHHIIDEVRPRVPLCDVIGMDPYPVSTRYPLRQVAEFAEKTQAAQFGSGPMWNVVQAFDWGSVRKDLPVTRFPNERELKSMLWQNVAYGATGLIGYSFFSMREGKSFETNWHAVCAAFGEVAGVTNILLSVERPPVVRTTEKDVAVRAWAKDGQIYVLACNLTEKPLSTRVTLAEGDGRIVGTLLGTPARSINARTLAFDLPPIGYSLIHAARCR